MITFNQKIKINKRPACRQAGMTYVELIVVLSIFAVLSSVVMFSYGDFQAKVDIKNLASDIALKIVEAQKSSLNGILPVAGYNADTWKPSYGIYLNTSTDLDPDSQVPFNKEFVYFADLNPNSTYDSATELLDTITITKNISISKIEKCTNVDCTLDPTSVSPLAIVFTRPNSSAVFTGISVDGSAYIKITVSSLSNSSIKASIKIYPSGRVQVN